MYAGVGIIGGTGLEKLLNLDENLVFRWRGLKINYSRGYVGDVDVVFIPRHGPNHEYPPHRVPYEAYITLLKCLGVDRVIGFSAVGSLRLDLRPGSIVIPDNIIDFSLHGRTFFDEDVFHVDFTHPYCRSLSLELYRCLKKMGINVLWGYTYVSTYGPRFESAAEIDFLRMVGGDIVGMTNIPESVLAREAGLHYTLVSVVSNYAAGIQSLITEEEVYKVVSDVINGLAEGIYSCIPDVAKAILEDNCSRSGKIFFEVVRDDCEG